MSKTHVTELFVVYGTRSQNLDFKIRIVFCSIMPKRNISKGWNGVGGIGIVHMLSREDRLVSLKIPLEMMWKMRGIQCGDRMRQV